MQESLLRTLGRLREAVDIAVVIGSSADPRVRAGVSQLAIRQAAVGDLNGARQTLQRMEASNAGEAASTRFLIDFWWGDPSVARTELKSVPADAFDKGYADCFDRVLDDRLAKRNSGPGLPPPCAAVQPDFRMRMLAQRGDIDGAYAIADQLVRSGDLSPVILYYPEMKPFRADRRFMPLAKRLGLLDSWRTSGQWPDFCKAPDRPYACAVEARGV